MFMSRKENSEDVRESKVSLSLCPGGDVEGPTSGEYHPDEIDLYFRFRGLDIHSIGG